MLEVFDKSAYFVASSTVTRVDTHSTFKCTRGEPADELPLQGEVDEDDGNKRDDQPRAERGIVGPILPDRLKHRRLHRLLAGRRDQRVGEHEFVPRVQRLNDHHRRDAGTGQRQVDVPEHLKVVAAVYPGRVAELARQAELFYRMGAAR